MNEVFLPATTLPATTRTEAALPDAARTELRAAVAVLEGVSLPMRLASVVGRPIEALKRSLPGPAQRLLDDSVARSLRVALAAALGSRPERGGRFAPEWLHRGLLAASGVAGGALGLPGTLLELPVSTTLLLRQVAAEASAQGEDLGDAAAQAECLKVFALGGRDPSDDNAEAGYFALRVALAQTLQGVASRGAAALLPGFLGAVAARFGAPVAIKLSAQAAPLVGAAAGAAINLAFLEHFRGIARAHFTVRRLERAHGVPAVRAAYAGMRDARFTEV